MVSKLTSGWNHSFISALGAFLFGPMIYLFSVHIVLLARRSWIICEGTVDDS